MKYKILFLFTWSILFYIPKLDAQNLFFKASGVLLPLDVNVLTLIDLGFECKMVKNWNAQLSYSRFSNGVDYYKEKKVWSLQLRRYYLGTPNTNGLYIGPILQKYNFKAFGDKPYSPNVSENIKEDKIGLGIIVGKHVKIWKHFGLDFHSGLLGQFGDKEITTTVIDNVTQMRIKTFESKKGKINHRVFWGLNLYIDLGDIPAIIKKKNIEAGNKKLTPDNN